MVEMVLLKVSDSMPLVLSSRYIEVGEQCEKETKTLASRMMFIWENKTSTRLRMVLKMLRCFSVRLIEVN